MGRLRRKRMHKNNKDVRKAARMKRYKRDLDQIQNDFRKAEVGQLPAQPVDYDLPGAGQFYCLVCARHFTSGKSLSTHVKTKPHKRKAKLAQEEPYTQEEANAAAGMGKADYGLTLLQDTELTDAETGASVGTSTGSTATTVIGQGLDAAGSSTMGMVVS